jgi:protein-S-isoprenylcysteine O-methyltransferase Ste14
MKNLTKRAFGGLFFLLVVMAAFIFLPAWTFNYWQAWIFLTIFFISVLAITIYLMKMDTALLERRVNAGPGAEKEVIQKIIQFVASIAFIAIFILSALDHRFVWSSVSGYIAIIGDVFVAVGLLAVFFVFKENTFTSGTIEVGAEQKVISTGLYGIVRHPMYAGAFIMLIGVPLALGSLWGLLAVALLVIAIIVRLLDEEKYLSKNLPGYLEYRKKVRYRLVPFVW